MKCFSDKIFEIRNFIISYPTSIVNYLQKKGVNMTGKDFEARLNELKALKKLLREKETALYNDFCESVKWQKNDVINLETFIEVCKFFGYTFK